MKDVIFDILRGSFPIFSLFSATDTAYLKHSLSLFFRFIAASLFFSYLGESV